jgi:membrane-associated phospholipid phosphatase
MPRNVRTPLLASGFCVAALAVLCAAAYAIGPVGRLDRTILLHLDRPYGSSARGFFDAVAQLGSLGPLLIGLGAICLLGWRLGRRREVYAALAVAAGANLTTQILKQALAHSRGHELGGFELPWATSFPSGHTTAAATLAAALFLVVPPRHRGLAALAGAAYALAVGLAVVAIGWHFPSDVLGGLLVVAAWTFAAIAALRLGTGRRGARAGKRAGDRLAISTE